MKLFHIVVICSFPLVFKAQSQEAKQLLFIGNSLTYYHDMPLILQEMLNETGIRISVHQATVPGISLKDHITNPKTIATLRGSHWDYVVLQEATVRVLIPESEKYLVSPAIILLDSLIKRQGAKTVLYQPYALSTYPIKYCYPSTLINQKQPQTNYCSIELTDSKQEFKIIEDSYNHLAGTIHGEIARVGATFELFKQRNSELLLFESRENRHPSRLGSYLIACVFFRHLTGRKASDLKYDAKLGKLQAGMARTIVDSL